MALSAPAEQYRVHFFPFFLRKTFSLVVHYFVPGSIPRKAHKLRNQKYLKLPFLPPNQSIKRNRLLFWLNMRSIFFFYAHSAFQIKNARRKEKELLSSMKKEKKKEKEKYAFTWRNTHIKYLQQKSLGTSVQKAAFYQHRFWRNSFHTCPFWSGTSRMVAIEQMTKGKNK